jgi:hypothetical protein
MLLAEDNSFQYIILVTKIFWFLPMSPIYCFLRDGLDSLQ